MKTADETWPRKFIVAGVAIVLVVAVVSVVINRMIDRETLSRIVADLHAFGHHWWAPLVLVVAYVLINLTGLPGTPLTLAAGAVWGWGLGSLWVTIATMIGTAVPYFVARHGAPRIQKLLQSRFEGVYRRIRNGGITAILLLRIVHVFPFAVISYGSGFARVTPRDYFLGTLLGTLPGILVYTYLADAILEGAISSSQAMWRILLAGSLLAALVIGSRYIAGRISD